MTEDKRELTEKSFKEIAEVVFAELRRDGSGEIQNVTPAYLLELMKQVTGEILEGKGYPEEDAAELEAIIKEIIDGKEATAQASDDPDFLEAARKTYEAFETIQNFLLATRETAEADGEQFVPPRSKRAENIEFPIDKVNNTVWRLMEDTSGQLTFAAEKKGSKKKLDIIYSVDFDRLAEDVTITKRLLPFDKRVYIATSALFNAGNNITTATQIHYAIGNTTRPKSGQITRIRDSIYKMFNAEIFLDNTMEAEVYKKYGSFKYKGSLLPVEILERYNTNNDLTEVYIKIFREPPLISFAKQRQQITTFPVELLQSPLNKTDANILIEDYLLERIARAKAQKGQNKILLSTLYKHANITTKKQKQRAPEKIERLFNFYVKRGKIKKFTITDESIMFYF